ncbi:MAG: hypothetical protein EB141_02010 [Verrucomicrobia bacterium]|nr:hypothetical protein [Verrucomicrobiota bacterium]NBU07627.1 hypothetical protein [Pseudomonadota bacterium]NDA65625.1 hypothetical protein [Verrucomicrobiota bacterium]NDB74419.1 hypothetical protein [Verrucomicrobiota bacterium]NDD37484.1 hypothetical protein [Verrucomicrobiota bacterium]
MKINKLFLTAAASLLLATSAKADFSVYITGSTAFRAAAYAAIASLYDSGFNVNASSSTAAPFTTIANAQAPNRPTSDSTYNGAAFMTFSGTMNSAFGSQIVTIYCNWSGSVEGIRDLTQGNSLPFLSTAVSQTTSFSDAGTTAVADFAFSDVFQSTTIYKTPTLQTLACGVVPFVFVKNNGATANLTNITHQQAINLFANGVVSLGSITGDTTTGTSSDTNKVACLIGRYNGSGTRAAVFADTGYGALKNSVNYKYSATAGPGSTAAFTIVTPDPNVGYLGGASIKTDLGNNISQALLVDGSTYGTGYAIGYLGVKDAFGVTGNSAGALNLTYDGTPFSTNAVQNGSYTLWSYEHFYNKSGINANLTTLKANIVGAIPANLGTGTTLIGIPASSMNVSRSVDGGPIAQRY